MPCHDSPALSPLALVIITYTTHTHTHTPTSYIPAAAVVGGELRCWWRARLPWTQSDAVGLQQARVVWSLPSPHPMPLLLNQHTHILPLHLLNITLNILVFINPSFIGAYSGGFIRSHTNVCFQNLLYIKRKWVVHDFKITSNTVAIVTHSRDLFIINLETLNFKEF